MSGLFTWLRTRQAAWMVAFGLAGAALLVADASPAPVLPQRPRDRPAASRAGLLWIRQRRITWLLVAAGCFGGLALWSLFAPSKALAAGWLVAVVFWLSIALGAFALLAVRTLTDGRWGDVAWPALAPAAATIPLFAVLGLPIALLLRAFYPWAADPHMAAAGVASHYLNPAFWSARGAIAFAGWTVFALLLLRRPSRLIAGLALCFHAVALTTTGMDWLLSPDPRFYSTDFGGQLGVLQILAALAMVAVLQVPPPGGPGRSGDIGGLMIATALGALYLGFSQYLVIWYGDLPNRAEWFIGRQQGVWLWLDVAAIMLSGVLPFFVLMRETWRNSPRVLGSVGALVLLGVFLHFVWLVGPAYGLVSLFAACLSAGAVGAGWLALTFGVLAHRLQGPHD